MAQKIIKSTSQVLHGSGAVRYRTANSAEGQLFVAFQVDYSAARVPEHFYVADYLEVHNIDPVVLLVFGKRIAPDVDDLRNKLEVYFPSQHFVTQLWRGSRDFHKALRGWCAEFQLNAVSAPPIKSSTATVKTIHANNALMVLAGGESLIDFFYLSPKDVSLKAPKGEDIQLMPLVRVLLAPNLLLGLLNACEPIVHALTPKYEITEDANEIVELR
jgi:hypothetical protein